MLTDEALKRIMDTAVQANGILGLPSVDTPCIGLPDGIELKNIEHLQKGRARFRGAYSTDVLGEFTSYVSARFKEFVETTKDPVQVFIDANAGKATAFFNLGTVAIPGHADDRALLSLRQTAAYAALLGLQNKKFRQRELAEWLEDWHDHLDAVYPGDDTAPPMSAAIAAIRDITITAKGETNSVQSDLGASRSVAEEIEAKSKRTLPHGFVFSVIPYDGFQQCAFALRLSVTPQEKEPLLALRIVGLADVQETIAGEFEDLVKRGVGFYADEEVGVDVFRGTFSP